MKTLSKTAALSKARLAVGLPHGRATSWRVVGPYRSSEPGGPSTVANFDSYTKASIARARWVAQVTFALMGRDDLIEQVDLDEYDVWRSDKNDATSIVNRILEKFETDED